MPCQQIRPYFSLGGGVPRLCDLERSPLPPPIPLARPATPRTYEEHLAWCAEHDRFQEACYRATMTGRVVEP